MWIQHGTNIGRGGQKRTENGTGYVSHPSNKVVKHCLNHTVTSFQACDKTTLDLALAGMLESWQLGRLEDISFF
jgi:hypothetical protein